MNDNGGDNIIEFAPIGIPPNSFALDILDQVIERDMDTQEAVEQLLTLVNAICVSVPELIDPVKSVLNEIGEEI